MIENPHPVVETGRGIFLYLVGPLEGKDALLARSHHIDLRAEEHLGKALYREVGTPFGAYISRLQSRSRVFDEEVDVLRDSSRSRLTLKRDGGQSQPVVSARVNFRGSLLAPAANHGNYIVLMYGLEEHPFRSFNLELDMVSIPLNNRKYAAKEYSGQATSTVSPLAWF